MTETETFKIDRQFAFLQTVRHSIEVLTEMGFEFDLIDDQDHEWILIGLAETEIGRVRIVIGVEELSGHWMVAAYHPLVIVSTLRHSASELFMRLNQQMVVGSWELDWNEGQVRVKTGTIFVGRALPKIEVQELIEHVLYALVDQHTTLVRSLFDGIAPEDLVVDEADSESE